MSCQRNPLPSKSHLCVTVHMNFRPKINMWKTSYIVKYWRRMVAPTLLVWHLFGLRTQVLSARLWHSVTGEDTDLVTGAGQRVKGGESCNCYSEKRQEQYLDPPAKMTSPVSIFTLSPQWRKRANLFKLSSLSDLFKIQPINISSWSTIFGI